MILLNRVALAWLLVLALAASHTTGAAAGTGADRTQPSECIERCDAIETRCGSEARRATRRCMAHPAGGGVDPTTLRRQMGSWYCAWFTRDHCADARDPRHCLERYAARHTLCVDAYDDNTTRQYLDCKAGERQALTLCREELADCRAACGE